MKSKYKQIEKYYLRKLRHGKRGKNLDRDKLKDSWQDVDSDSQETDEMIKEIHEIEQKITLMMSEITNAKKIIEMYDKKLTRRLEKKRKMRREQQLHREIEESKYMNEQENLEFLIPQDNLVLNQSQSSPLRQESSLLQPIKQDEKQKPVGKTLAELILIQQENEALANIKTDAVPTESINFTKPNHFDDIIEHDLAKNLIENKQQVKSELMHKRVSPQQLSQKDLEDEVEPCHESNESMEVNTNNEAESIKSSPGIKLRPRPMEKLDVGNFDNNSERLIKIKSEVNYDKANPNNLEILLKEIPLKGPSNLPE